MRKTSGKKSENVEKYRKVLSLAKRKPELSQRELAAEAGVSRALVAKALEMEPEYRAGVTLFRKQRPDILAEKQRILLSALNQKKVDGMSGKDLVISAAVLQDKEFLLNKQANPISGLLAAAEKIDGGSWGEGRRRRVRASVEVEIGGNGRDRCDNPAPIEIEVEPEEIPIEETDYDD